MHSNRRSYTSRQGYIGAIMLGIMLLLPQARTAGQKKGQAFIDSLIAAEPFAKPDTARARLLALIGFKYALSEPGKGADYAGRALTLSQRIGWKRGAANAYNILGLCAYTSADYEKAMSYFNPAMALFKEEHDQGGLLKVISNIGNINVSQSDFPKALENNFLALKYAEELRDTVSITISLNNIGSIYEYLSSYDKGLEYNLKALKLLRQINDSVGIAVTLGNIGNLYSDKKMPAEALRFQQQALASHEQLGDLGSVTRDLMNIGTAYADVQQYAKGVESYFKALKIARQTADEPIEATILTNLGYIYTQLASDSVRKLPGALITPQLAADYGIPVSKPSLLADAIRYLKMSIAIDTGLHNLNGLYHSYGYLSLAQLQAGQPAAALVSNNLYHAFKDSVSSLDSKLQVANLEAKRELELKEKQIEIDRLEVAKKRNERGFFIAGIALLLVVAGFVFRNFRLKSAKELSENKLSAFQARMNPHFIFNSLNSIQSLVLNSETVPAITYLSRFSKLMRQILDSSAKSKVLLQTELDMLRGYIKLEQLRFDRFRYELNVATDISPEGTELPAMIIQPFVENAIIHGILPKADEGVLTVSFTKEADCIICTIDDNGIGRKASAALNAARRKDHESHGISIASNRLALLSKSTKGGVTYIDKEEGGIPTGTTVILHIPLL